MNSRRFIICTLVAASSAALPSAGFAACDARSGPKTAALVELYTSEGCSSCPPADRQLSRLQQALDPAAKVVPLTLHAGITLADDHVVREWIGPIRLAGGAVQTQREITLPATWNRAQLEVIAFVQDERSGSVLQALNVHQCAGS